MDPQGGMKTDVRQRLPTNVIPSAAEGSLLLAAKQKMCGQRKARNPSSTNEILCPSVILFREEDCDTRNPLVSNLRGA